MIKLIETRTVYAGIGEDQSYTLINATFNDCPEDDYIEIYDSKSNLVDNDKWNQIVNYWEIITEQ